MSPIPPEPYLGPAETDLTKGVLSPPFDEGGGYPAAGHGGRGAPKFHVRESSAEGSEARSIREAGC
ncbi:MAG: hypothetical protein QXX56_03085 [Candidatus Bathyarchaeia archaeon]